MIDAAQPRLTDLAEIARQAMREHGLEPDIPPEVLREVAAIAGPAQDDDPSIRDLRDLPWASIDDDDSRDLDQLTVARPADEDGRVSILVAIADVDALVPKDSATDRHAQRNTVTVYTPGDHLPAAAGAPLDRPDLAGGGGGPPRHRDRDGRRPRGGDRGVGRLPRPRPQPGEARLPRRGGLAGRRRADAGEDGPRPGLDAQLRLQNEVAQRLNGRRHERGALDFQSVEARPIVKDGVVVGLDQETKSSARRLIEDFMIAANGVTAAYLRDHGFPSIRRVVRAPERWDRIQKLAADAGETLPETPDPAALAAFMARRRAADPLRYPDLSLAIVKLMGSGDYAVEPPGGSRAGHFGLAARDYGHATAPNRRYPDLLTQRLLKAAIAGQSPPYDLPELERLAEHCTRQEDQARKVERQARKAAASAYLGTRIGQQFDALVTGVTDRGTWVRTLDTPVEGKLVAGFEGLEVGDRVRVRLEAIDPSRGFVDFARAVG